MTIANRLDALFSQKKNILSIFLTAGFPKLGDTVPLLQELEKSGVDLAEIGFPFSDPLADGPTIQQSSEAALKNGMTLKVLFEQLREVRETVSIPLILMGYFNPVLRFGVENFCKCCSETGIDGVILPDLPMAEFDKSYRPLFESHNLHFIFLITPSTADERIRIIDAKSSSFIYAVSSAAITGGKLKFDETREAYFRKLRSLELKHPILVGFGISDKAGFSKACEYANGGIIGSAFIEAIRNECDLRGSASRFIAGIR